MAARFGRVVTAMVTPFKGDDLMQVDLDRAQELAVRLVDTGNEGLVVCGSTGESATLERDEKKAMFAAVVEAVGDRAKVIAGTGTYDTHETVMLTRAAQKAGCDGVLVVTPYYSKPPQDALLEHFRAAADASDLPVMMYDVPSRTATKIAPDTLLRAAEHPRIVAVKEASGDFSAVAHYAPQIPDHFQIYSGNDDHTLALQPFGAVGVVSVVGHFTGHAMQRQFDAFDSGDIAGAAKAQASYQDLFEAVFADTNPIGVKSLLAADGFDVGGPRKPQRPATPDHLERMTKALKQFREKN